MVAAPPYSMESYFLTLIHTLHPRDAPVALEICLTIRLSISAMSPLSLPVITCIRISNTFGSFSRSNSGVPICDCTRISVDGMWYKTLHCQLISQTPDHIKLLYICRHVLWNSWKWVGALFRSWGNGYLPPVTHHFHARFSSANPPNNLESISYTSTTGFSLLYCQDSLVDGIELFDHVRKVQSCGIVHTHYRDSLSSASSSLLQSEQGEQLLPHAPQSLQVCLAKQDQHLAACTDIDWKHWYTVAGIHLYNPPSPGHTSRKKANITTMQSLCTLVIISEPTICCIGKTNKTIHNSHMQHVTV